MKRGGPLRRRKGLRRRNPERAARLRAEQFGPQAELCRELPCCVPGCATGQPSDPAHVRSRGAGGRDEDTVPLCRTHHDQQHSLGIKTFQRVHQLDLHGIARALSDRVRYDPPEPHEGDRFTFGA